MTKQENLQLLKKLEDFRIKMIKGEITEGCSDWIVRMCQAYVAEEHFKNRMEWSIILRLEEKARKAFWGGQGTEIITNEYPNGCTLQEAINYFIEHGEEFECLGLI